MKRSLHSLTNTQTFTCDPGELIPCPPVEIVPGDTLQGKTHALIRALPTLAPIMHAVTIRVQHWFVPHRLTWDSWTDFITGGEDGLDASVLPTIDFSSSAVTKGTLANYLGLPVGFNASVSALPFRAYAMIYNEWYRDTELQSEIGFSDASGVDSTTNTDLKNINWERDRFVGASATEQLGSSVSLPLGTQADVKYDSAINGTDRDGKFVILSTSAGGEGRINYGDTLGTETGTMGNSYDSNIYADLTNASAATINELREAIALQKFAEMRALYGSRYSEMLRTDFGVTPEDGRLSRPELLASGKSMLNFSEVLATAETGTSVDVGDMKGHAIAAVKSNRYRKFFTEFGYLISFISIRPKSVYAQGVDKHWLKTAKEDFYNKHLENMGMQEIENQELYHDHTTPTGTFGYEPRYQEYRKANSRYAGEFADSTLNYWHMGRDFSSDPALNSSFITCSPTDRVFAQSTTDNMLCMVQNSIQARRVVKKSVKPIGLI
jgi:hypothetical protein